MEEKTEKEEMIKKQDEVKEEVVKEAEVIAPSNKEISIASLVLGIVSVVLFFYSWISVSVPCGILAIIFGIMGKKRDGKKMAKAGFILGIIGLGLWALIILIVVGLFGLVGVALL